MEENNAWTQAVYFPTTSVRAFIVFFKYLNSRTSAGLLFAANYSPNESSFFGLNKFYCKNI
jgi:hypothetical protein